MKKKVLFAAMLSATLLGATQAVKAHPGRTDGNGCHTCRTNCEKWGLAYGEYHCHNGNSSASSSNSSSNQTKPSTNTTTNSYTTSKPTVTKPKIDYKAIGKKEGYAAKIKEPNRNLKNIKYKYKDSNYRSAFDKAFLQDEKELRKKSETLAKQNGEKDAITTEKYQLATLPKNIIKEVYTKHYKEAYDAKEKLKLNEIYAMADKDAFTNIYNEEEAKRSFDLKKFSKHYISEYNTYRENYIKEKKNFLEMSKTNGKEDAKEHEDKNYQFLDSVKDTKFYKEAKAAYDASYDDNLVEVNPIESAIILGVFIIIIYVIVRKIKKIIKRRKLAKG